MARVEAPQAQEARPESEDWIMIDAEKGGLDRDAELDLCFICDCTGSMGSYIKAAQENIQSIVTKINAHGAKVRFGLISYRDHPPQEKTYVTQCMAFTEDIGLMRSYVDTMKAHGGGDGPEAVTAALAEALAMPWRPNATRICVLIADAPPHGLEPSGDGFPNGDPEGRDPLAICHDMAQANITVYTVGCEPALGHYLFARDFFCTVAETTGGQAVALGSAALLADVIINGSCEELALAKLQRQVEEEVLKVQTEAKRGGRTLDKEAQVTAAVANLQAMGVASMQMETDGRMQNATRGLWGDVREKKSLASVKEDLGKLPQASHPMGIPGVARSRGYGKGAPLAAPAVTMPAAAPVSRTNFLKKDLINHEQVSRIVQKAQCQSRLL